MARTRRIKFTDRDALHHVTSRVSGRQMLLAGAGVKDDMLDALERAAEFSGVNVGAFALMDNHFHIVVQVPFREGTCPQWFRDRMISIIQSWRMRISSSKMAKRLAILDISLMDCTQTVTITGMLLRI